MNSEQNPSCYHKKMYFQHDLIFIHDRTPFNHQKVFEVPIT